MRVVWLATLAAGGAVAASPSRPPIGFGTPVPLADSTTPRIAQPTSVNPWQRFLLADVTGDGKADIVAAPGTREYLIVHAGNGDGTFGPPVDVGVGRDWVNRICAGRLNDDAAADLVMNSAGGPEYQSIDVLLSDGAGGFRRYSYPTPAPMPGEFESPVLVDWDGDGRTDIVTASYGWATPGHIRVRLNQGDGTFGAAQTIIVRQNSAPDAAVIDVPGVNVVAADFDADGLTDLAVQMFFTVRVLWRQADGSLVAGPTLGPSRHDQGALAALVAADLDGDGLVDLATAGCRLNWGPHAEDGSVFVFRHSGPRSFAADQEYVCAGEQTSVWDWDIAAVDFDGDGRPELVTPQALFANAGDGTFVGPFALPVPRLALEYSGVAAIAADGVVGIVTGGTHGGATWIPIGPAGPAPSIETVTPSPIEVGTTLEVELRGVGIEQGAVLDFGPGVVVDSTTVLSSTSVRVEVTVAVDAVAGVRDVVLKNPDGGVASATFSIVNDGVPAPDGPGSIDVQCIRGDCSDRPGSKPDNFSVSGSLAFNDLSTDGRFDPKTENAVVSFGDPESPVVVNMPAAKGWRVHGARAVWRSGRGAAQRTRLALDFRKGTFRLDVVHVDATRLPSEFVTVGLALGGDRGQVTRNWAPGRRGGLVLRRDTPVTYRSGF